MFERIEEQVRSNVEWLRLLVEALGALVIAVGVVIAIIGLLRHALVARSTNFTPIRLAFARYLTLALELQLAADILSTSVAPTWERIGKLAAIAIIRTALNYFLAWRSGRNAKARTCPARAAKRPGSDQIIQASEQVRRDMAEKSIIEWTRSTFNPWIGCTKVSPGCDGCYAAISTPARSMKIEWGTGKPRHRTSPSTWAQVRRWNAKAAATGDFWPVFTASLADVFDNEVPEEWRAELWALIRECRHLTFQIVTKRIGNVPRMLPPDWGDAGYPNVWLLITVVNQEEADRDIPKLLRVPARIHGLSMEPLLGPVDLRMNAADRIIEHAGDTTSSPRIDWVITGGESGAAARAPHPDWLRSLRDQCLAAGTAFFFKRWGEWRPAGEAAAAPPDDKQAHAFADGAISLRIGKKNSGRELDGRTWDQLPDPEARTAKPVPAR